MSEGNGGTQRELGSIQATLTNIQAELADAKTARRAVYEKIEEQGREIVGLKSDVAAVKVAVDEIKPQVAEFQKLRNRGIGILIGMTAVGGGVGAAVTKLLGKFGFGSG